MISSSRSVAAAVGMRTEAEPCLSQMEDGSKCDLIQKMLPSKAGQKQCKECSPATNTAKMVGSSDRESKTESSCSTISQFDLPQARKGRESRDRQGLRTTPVGWSRSRARTWRQEAIEGESAGGTCLPTYGAGGGDRSPPGEGESARAKEKLTFPPGREGRPSHRAEADGREVQKDLLSSLEHYMAEAKALPLRAL